jgi:hypothetical protein
MAAIRRFDWFDGGKRHVDLRDSRRAMWKP